MGLLLETINGRWRPGIGDPSLLGWATAALFLIAAILGFRCAVKAARDHEASPRNRRLHAAFWGILSTGMLLLAANKQLDLQTVLTQIGRDLAESQGWYDERRNVQWWFILAFTVAAVLAFAAIAGIGRGLWRRQWPAMVGAFLIICFIVARAASFHHVDEILKIPVTGVPMHRLLELGGAVFIAVAGALELRRGYTIDPRC